LINGKSVVVDAPRAGGGIQRLALLNVLQHLCAEVGVGIQFNQRITGVDELCDCDLLVGADGLSSIVRKRFAAEFGASERELTNRFAWYGVEQAFDMPTLSFVESGHGVWVAHYYRYSPTMSTFLVECDASTWQSSSLAAMTEAAQRALVEQLFASELQGARLIGNHSVWRRFTVVHNDRWHERNVALLGDALHTIHFSIGSGTRVAMEDSIALAQSLEAHPADVAVALREFERARRPVADKLAIAAERSFEWYERMRDAMRVQDPWEFAYRYLTRTGRVDDRRLSQMAPEFMTQYRERQGASVMGAG
jgi:2-polyprenyl-6-methoxyphenol hydroxylase-like FAD-dependent oxidoreductase